MVIVFSAEEFLLTERGLIMVVENDVEGAEKRFRWACAAKTRHSDTEEIDGGAAAMSSSSPENNSHKRLQWKYCCLVH